MKSYGEVRQELADKMGPTGPIVRTDYQCKAHGCPNTGTLDGDVCYFHFREPDPAKWHTITQRIREDFHLMRNHGRPHTKTGVSTWPG